MTNEILTDPDWSLVIRHWSFHFLRYSPCSSLRSHVTVLVLLAAATRAGVVAAHAAAAIANGLDLGIGIAGLRGGNRRFLLPRHFARALILVVPGTRFLERGADELL